MLLSTALLACSLQSVQQGTLLVDLVPGPGTSTPRGYTRAGDYVQFWAVGGIGQTQVVWATDGTAAGTRQLKPSVGGTTFIENLGSVGDRAFFGETDVEANTRLLWSTDGTPEGTAQFDAPVLPYSYTDLPVQVVNGLGYTLHRTQFPGFGLLKPRDLLARTDGTATGTEVLETSPALGFELDLQESLAGEDRLWLRNRTDDGQQLFSTDGAPGALQLELVGSGDFDLLTTVGSRCIYLAELPNGGLALSSLDAGSGAPLQLAEIPGASNPQLSFRALARTGDRLVFLRRFNGGQELVSSHVAAAGLTLLLDLSSYEPVLEYLPFAETSGRCALLLQPLGATSSEVWFSDGSPQGTTLSGTVPFELSSSNGLTASVNADERIVIAGRSPGQPGTLWVADPAGVQLAAEISAPTNDVIQAEFSLGAPTRIGNSILFTGRDAAGYELHALELPATGGPAVTSLGGGCAAAGVTPPSIEVTGPLALGTNASFQLQNGAPLSTTLWFQDLGLTGIGTPGTCTVALPSPAFVAQRPTDGAGEAAWDVQIPATPGLLGLSLRFQTLSVELGGPAFGLGALTNVLEIGLAP